MIVKVGSIIVLLGIQARLTSIVAVCVPTVLLLLVYNEITPVENPTVSSDSVLSATAGDVGTLVIL